ncbi:MAG TPA: SDR family oxidoreductase [Candidatus Eremiobacteraceae bacterium]|nr:SDR family oxidoreductase [Candidatus Eremiobacteraceae bacterium]
MSETLKLHGRVALVTGAAKRLGRVVALRLAQQGADVAIHYGTSANEARQLASELQSKGRRSVALQAELTSVPAIENLVSETLSYFGHLDILINSAASFLETTFGQTSEQTWDTSLGTNLKAPFFCAQSAAPHLAKSGHGAIINFADLGGILGWPDFLPHSLGKAGLIMLTRILAKELAPNIRVNAIAPGTITMPGDPPAWEANFIRRAPLGRTGRPEEVADAVMFLLTAEFMTGQVLILDGGSAL